MKENHNIEDILGLIDDAVKVDSKESAEIVEKIINSQASLIEKLQQSHTLLDKLVQLQVLAGDKLDSFSQMGAALILRLNERELELTRKALNDKGTAIRVIEDSLHLTKVDSEGNTSEDTRFVGNLTWITVTKDGVILNTIKPDSLIGISFQHIPLLAIDVETALIAAYSPDKEDAIYRFTNDRVGEAFAENKQPIDRIRPLSSLKTSLKFETKHEQKLKAIENILNLMEEVRGYETLGLTIKETFRMSRDSKTGKPEKTLMTEIGGLFYSPEVTTKTEKFDGALEYAEWVIFEEEKSSKKITTKSVNTGLVYKGNRGQVDGVLFSLRELLANDRAQVIERIKEFEENPTKEEE